MHSCDDGGEDRTTGSKIGDDYNVNGIHAIDAAVMMPVAWWWISCSHQHA